MGSWSDRARQTEAEDLRMLEPRDRLDFERLLQGVRVSFLASSVLILVAFGLAVLPYAALVVVAVGGSYALIALLRRYRAELLLRWQLWLRVFDCAVIYVVLVNYHAFLHDAYYDAVCVLFVVAAAATHGRLGAWTLSLVAGLAVLASRMQLIASGALVNSARHLTDVVFYLLFFLVTSTAVAFLMRKTAEVVLRREKAWRLELAARNADLEQTARQLDEAMQLRDTMLTGVGHDLRTPLTVIKVQAQLARRRATTLSGFDDAGLLRGIDQIDRAASRINHWIEELLDVSRLRKPEDITLTRTPTDLVRLTRQTIDEHEQNTSRHEFQVDTDGEPIVGLWDAGRLERVLDNVIGNAIKYSPGGGCIWIALSAGDDWAKLTVQDEGVGIPAADAPRIFEPFQRASNVVGRFSGTGIGLSGSRRIVERHGGTIELTSVEQHGTTVIVRLPLHPPHES